MNERQTQNCPNCGAPITGSECEYCGARHVLDLSILEGKKVKVSFDHLGIKQIFELYVTSIDFTYEYAHGRDIFGNCLSLNTGISVAIYGDVMQRGKDN